MFRRNDPASTQRKIAAIAEKPAAALSDKDFGFLERCLQDLGPEVRAAAADAMQQFPGSGMAAPLLSLLGAEQDPSVRAKVLDSLVWAALGEQDAVEQATDEDEEPDYENETSPVYGEITAALLTAASDPREAVSVRATAIEGLGDLSDDSRVRGTYYPFLGAEEPELRVAALKAIGYAESAEGVEDAILALMDDPVLDVRKQAVIASGLAVIEAALERVTALLQSPEPALRGAAWGAYASLAPVEEAEALLKELDEQLAPEDPQRGDLEWAMEELGERVRAEDDVDDEWDEAEEEADRDGLVAAFEEEMKGSGADEESAGQAGFIARNFLEFLDNYLGEDLEGVDRHSVQEYLLEHYPRKVTVSLDEENPTPEALALFLEHLGRAGEVTDGPALATHARSLAKRFDRAIRDPQVWGPAKTMAMAALAEGVDLNDDGQMQAFIERYNQRLPGVRMGFQGARPAAPPPEAPPIVPQRRAAPKVGRNEPCPCGSGKKYKKCCGA